MSLKWTPGTLFATATVALGLFSPHAGCIPGGVDGLSSGSGAGERTARGSAVDASNAGAETDGASGGNSAAGSPGDAGSRDPSGGANNSAGRVNAGAAGGSTIGTGGRSSSAGGASTGADSGVGGANNGGVGGASSGAGGLKTGGASGAGTGGTSGANTGGTSGANTGGTSGANTGGTGGASAGGSAGSGGSMGTVCQDLSGCSATQVCNSGRCVAPQGVVAFSVPLTKSGQDQRYADKFSPAPNLTGTTVTMRLYAPGATGGSLVVYLSDADFTAGSGVTVPFSNISKGWKDVSFAVGGVSGGFNPAQISQVTIEVTSGNTGPWTNPTVVYLDSVRTSDMSVDDTFDTSLGATVASSTQVVAGSTFVWRDSVP